MSRVTRDSPGFHLFVLANLSGKPKCPEFSSITTFIIFIKIEGWEGRGNKMSLFGGFRTKRMGFLQKEDTLKEFVV